ncbi:MAG: nucleotide sugar dehydrogenase [Methanothrix sp.]|jgi:UDP-N-acetyl-D-mannosaminuronic acid dehydrogenase|nr:nucleotide sugar dehydrogenase [Methanothrix sp.]
MSEECAKIAVIGLGNAGLPLAAIVADSGIMVMGVDINEERCRQINRGDNPIPEETGLEELIKQHGGKRLLATPRFGDARSCQTFIVIVPVFVDIGNNPDFSIMQKALHSLGKILKKGDLVVLETTFPPGTTEGLAQSWLCESSGLLQSDFFLAYSPERIMTGYSLSRLREFPKVIGGRDEESGIIAYQVYKKFICNLHLVSSAKVAEMIKVMEGCYRDVNIALANELFKICEELGIDFFEARDKANHQFCHIHLPSTGVGGHCIPVYPWFLIKEMEKREHFSNCRLLCVSRQVNDEMIRYWAERILLECMKINKPLFSIKICIKGITFRAGVKEFYHSRNLGLARLLADKGLDVYIADPLLTRDEVIGKGLRYIKPEESDLIFDPFELKFQVSGIN